MYCHVVLESSSTMFIGSFCVVHHQLHTMFVMVNAGDPPGSRQVTTRSRQAGDPLGSRLFTTRTRQKSQPVDHVHDRFLLMTRSRQVHVVVK
jgi:hypothetical protein